jgi:glycine/D-amino acid oxidase-like deaminating enzyme
MRPCASDALPVMGELPGFKGAYISTAHNCWGILWAPACGKAMAELVMLGHTETINLSPFSIARFMPKKTGDRGRKVGDVSVGEQW